VNSDASCARAGGWCGKRERFNNNSNPTKKKDCHNLEDLDMRERGDWVQLHDENVGDAHVREQFCEDAPAPHGQQSVRKATVDWERSSKLAAFEICICWVPGQELESEKERRGWKGVCEKERVV
jgi:hypothetical protein